MDRAHRPILRRVFEGDSPAAVPMCLVVCGIRTVPEARPLELQQLRSEACDATSTDVVDAGGPVMFELELTDGALQVRSPCLLRG